jgi:hypothetical protein
MFPKSRASINLISTLYPVNQSTKLSNIYAIKNCDVDKMKIIRLILFLLLLVFVYNIGIADSTGIITGTVVDRETGIPIPGAKVMINGDSIVSTTDQRGFFNVNNRPAGVFKLKASCIGYQDTWIMEVSLSSGAKLNVLFSLLTSTLHEPYDTASFNHNVGIIKGKVLNKQDNAPIGSAVITVKNSNIKVLADDVTGEYLIRNIPPGKYEIQISHPGYNNQTHIVFVKAKNIRKENFYLSDKK